MLFEDMKNLSDEGRDLPMRWNIMHMYSCSQLAKIIALRRGMDIELAPIAAAMHDIAIVATKKAEGHAKRAEAYIRDAINKYNNEWSKGLSPITEEEEDMLVDAIAKHSDKETYSDNSFIELLKDIDSVDRYLHGVKTEGAYLERANRVLKELGVALKE